MRVLVERPDDERLADYVRLRDASLRRHLEAERGLFIAEGAKVIRRAWRPATGPDPSCSPSAGWPS